MNLKEIHVTLCDLSLNDLMYLRPGSVRLDELLAVACALDAAGVPLIEIGTGAALGLQPVGQNWPGEGMQACLRAIGPRLKRARLAIQLLAGAGTVDQLQRARDWGVAAVSITATWLDAGLIAPRLRQARRLGLDAAGVLMMVQETGIEVLVQQALIMEAEGAQCVTLADGAGSMDGAQVRSHMQALRQALRPDTELGFHGHAAMAPALSNSLAAIDGGARRIEGSLVWPGIGHTPIDALCASCNRMGAVTGVDAYQLSDIRESLVATLDRPVMLREVMPFARVPAPVGTAPFDERRNADHAKRRLA